MDYSIEFDIEDLDKVAREVIENANCKTLCFYGEMGAGKTTLIKALVKALGGGDEVSSPTFSLVNEYEVADDLVYHFDMYRIDDPTEALDFGFEDYLASGCWVFIEWPGKIDVLLPELYEKIDIKTGKKCSRSLSMELVNKGF